MALSDVLPNVSLHTLSNLTISNLAILIIVALLIGHFAKSASQWRCLPPGPWGLPFLGYLPFLDSDVTVTFRELSKKYGPVFGLKLGSRYVVVASDRKSMLEAFHNSDFNGRPEKCLEVNENSTHIGEANGRPWLEQRKFVENHLKQFTRGNDVYGLSSLVEVNVEAILTQLSSTGVEEDVQVHRLFSDPVRNIITQSLWSKPYDNDGPVNIKNLEELQHFILQGATPTPPLYSAYFPWLFPLLKKISSTWKSHYATARKCEKMFNNIIESHLKSHGSGEDADFIDHYLTFMKKSQETSDTFNLDNLNVNLQILLLGATDTVIASMEMLFLALTRDQLLQDKIYREVVNVLGTEGKVRWSDRAKFPFTMAAIYESQRHNLIVPISSVRCTLQDTTLSGYHIPKGSLLFPFSLMVHNDPNDWNEPDKFKPERYLNPDGSFDNKQCLLTFSIGRRNCPGKELALTQIFLMTTSILQRFKLLPSDSTTDIRSGLVLAPTNPLVRVKQR